MTTAGSKLLTAHGIAVTYLVALHCPPEGAVGRARALQAAADTRDRVLERFEKHERAREAGRAVLGLLDAHGSLDNHGHNPWPAHDSACEVCRTLNALRGAIEVLDLDDQKPDLCPPSLAAEDEALRAKLRAMGYWDPAELAAFLRGTLGAAAEAPNGRGRLWRAILQYVATIGNGKSQVAARTEVERVAFGEEAAATDTAIPAPAQSILHADEVAGRHFRGALDDFEESCRKWIEAERDVGLPDHAAIDLLSDAVRLAREYHDAMLGTERAFARMKALAHERAQALWRPRVEALERALDNERRRVVLLRQAIERPCPITGDEFFAVMAHPDRGMIPTYGGPRDSYGPCERTEPHGDLYRWHIDHDQGLWTELEGLGLRVVDPDAEAEPDAVDDEPAAPAAPPPPPEPLTRCRWRSGGCEDIARFVLETTKRYFVDQATRFPVCASCAKVHDGTHGYPTAVRLDPMPEPGDAPSASAVLDAVSGKTFGPDEGERGAQ